MMSIPLFLAATRRAQYCFVARTSEFSRHRLYRRVDLGVMRPTSDFVTNISGIL